MEGVGGLIAKEVAKDYEKQVRPANCPVYVNAGTPLRKRRRRFACGMEGLKVAVHGLIGRPVAGSWQTTISVPGPMAGSFVLYAGPLPANTWVPLLPM